MILICLVTLLLMTLGNLRQKLRRSGQPKAILRNKLIKKDYCKKKLKPRLNPLISVIFNKTR